MAKFDRRNWRSAWTAAESLALRNRDTRAVIYRTRLGPLAYEVRLAGEPVEHDLVVQTTVSRIPLPNGADEGSCRRLVDAVGYILLNLPYKTALAPIARVDRHSHAGIATYRFLTTANEEIASWYVNDGMIHFYPGLQGSGRRFRKANPNSLVKMDTQIEEARRLLHPNGIAASPKPELRRDERELCGW